MEKYLIILIIIMILYYIQKYCIRSEVDKILITKNIIEKYVNSDSRFYTTANTLHQLGGLNLTSSLVINNKYKLTADDDFLRLTDALSGNLSNLYVNNLDISGELNVRQGISSTSQSVSFTNSNNGVLLIDNKDNMAGLKSLNGPLNINVPSISTIQFSGNTDISGDFKFNNVKPILIKMIFIGTSNNINTQVSYSTYSGIAFSGYNRITPILSTNTIQFNTYKDSVSGNWFISFTQAIPSTETILRVRLTFFHKNFVSEGSPVNLTLGPTLAEPGTIIISQPIVGQVNLTWTESLGAPADTSYTVIGRPQNSIINPTNSSATVTGLVPGQSYTFTVDASANGYTSSRKTSTSITLNPLASPVVTVSTTTPPTSTTVTLNITAPTNAQTDTGISYNITGLSPNASFSMNSMNNIATITGLEPEMTYYFIVEASNSNSGFTSFSQIEVDTLGSLIKVIPVVNIESYNIIINWSLPLYARKNANTGANYTVNIYRGDRVTESATITQENITNTSIVVSGLPFDKYVVTVTALRTGEPNVISDPIYFEAPKLTRTLTEPETISVSQSIVGQVNLTWTGSLSNPANTTYRVINKPPGSTVTLYTNSSATITGLVPGTYTFTVQASAPEYISSQNSTQEVTLDALEAPQVRVSQNTPPTSTTVTLNITAPTNAPTGTDITYNITNLPSNASFIMTNNNTIGTIRDLPTNIRTYNFIVEASYNTFTSTTSIEAITLASTLAEPGTINVSQPIVGQVNLTWTGSPGAPAGTNYTVINQPPGSTVTLATNSSATVTGLVPGQSYTFTVDASANGYTSSRKTSTSITLNPLASPVVTVSTTTPPTTTIVTLNITAPTNARTDTSITYNITNLPSNALFNMTNNNTIGTISNLPINIRTYNFIVQATNSGFTSTTPIQAITLAPTLAEPGTIDESQPIVGQVNLTWTESLGAPAGTSYRVINQPLGSTVTLATNSSATVTGLVPGQSYTFTVDASANGYTSSRKTSTSITLNPLASPVVTVSTTTPPTTTSITLNITAPTNAQTDTSISYNITNLPPNASFSMNNNNTIGTISDLSANTVYNFIVQATNSGFTSTTPTPIQAITLASLIRVIPTVNVASSGDLIIDWSAYQNANIGANYTVNIYRGNTVTETPITTQENIIGTNTVVSGLPDDSYTVTVTALRTGESDVISYPIYPNVIAPIVTNAYLVNNQLDKLNGTVTIIWVQDEYIGTSNRPITGYRILNNGIPLAEYSNIPKKIRQQDVILPNDIPYSLTLQGIYQDEQNNNRYISATSISITGTPRRPLIGIIPEAMTDSGNITIDWSESLSTNANIDANYTVIVLTEETGEVAITIPNITTLSTVVTGLSPGRYNFYIITSRYGDDDIISDDYPIDL